MKKRLTKIMLSASIVLSLSFIFKYYLLNAQEKLNDEEPMNDLLELAEPISSEMKMPDKKEDDIFDLETQPSQDNNLELLSIDFEDTDIRDVIRVISEASDTNMIVSPDIKVKVTVQLKNVTWEQALDMILRTYSLTYKREGSLVRIMTLDQMKIEEEKIPLVTKIVRLNFAKAEEIKPSLEKTKSSRGSIETNTRTNSLIITDLPEIVQQIENIANQLDTRTPQVMIEALMADVKITADENLGIDWDLKHPDRFYERTLAQDLQLSGSAAATIAFGKTILRNYEIAGLIEMWKEDKRVNILANPKVMTLDNLQAAIELVEQVPYTKVTTNDQGGSTTSTQFKDAGIKLFVTPHITTKDNWISMNVKVEQSFRSGYVGSTNEPIIDARKAETNLMVRDGETIVIGGLRKKEDTITVDKVPILGDVPLLGILFRRTTKSKANIDLLIFITPRIIEESVLTIKEKVRLELFKEEPRDKTGMEKKILKRIEEQEIEKRQEEKIGPAESRSLEPSQEGSFSLRPPGKED